MSRYDDDDGPLPSPWEVEGITVSSNLTTFPERSHEFLTAKQRKALDDQEALDIDLWRERGFSIGFGSYE